MKSIESLEEFYQRKFEWVPEDLSNDLGHFNIFQLEPLRTGEISTIPYRRRDFYKVMLVFGNSKVHYADKIYEVKKQALSFSNPQIPYKWEHIDKIYDGVYCVFNSQFFHQFGQFDQYEIFQPNGNHVFELTDAQAEELKDKFRKLEEEFYSGYKYKFDVIKNIVLDLIHYGLKLEPSTTLETEYLNASYRITKLFLELLDRQFPLDENYATVALKTPSDFAEKLNVHVNSLNRAVKSTTSKTTSTVIADRLLKESKAMLKQTSKNVSEIAYGLGFKEVTHFNNFFKKHSNVSPLQFRNSSVV